MTDARINILDRVPTQMPKGFDPMKNSGSVFSGIRKPWEKLLNPEDFFFRYETLNGFIFRADNCHLHRTTVSYHEKSVTLKEYTAAVVDFTTFFLMHCYPHLSSFSGTDNIEFIPQFTITEVKFKAS